MLVYEKPYAIICTFLFIAGIHNFAKVWVSHSEYTILVKNNSRGNGYYMEVQI